ncbi:MAG: hypothetical protein JWM32_3249 [Verrucomicrobia bacterium]|nr:hypothetical protein [Verrucomicrobiota bacterium]
MKIRFLAAFCLGLAAYLTTAGQGSDRWYPVPADIAREIDNYFTTMDLALAHNRIELVMGLYTAEVTEEIEGANPEKFEAAAIRQRRQAQMDNYIKNSTTPPVLSRKNFWYQRGSRSDNFWIRYAIYQPGAGKTLAGSVDYEFLRTDRGLVVDKIVSHNDPSASVTAKTAPPKRKIQTGPGLPTEVELTNGVTLHKASVVHWYYDKVVLKHQAGTDPIKFEHIILEQRGLFIAEQEAGLNAQRESFQHAAVVEQGRQQIQALNDMSEQQRQDAAAAYEAAVSQHRLMVGMSMSQVRRSWGQPSRTMSIDSTNGRGMIWTYDGRGVDPQGNVRNAGVGFENDIVIELFNIRQR